MRGTCRHLPLVAALFLLAILALAPATEACTSLCVPSGRPGCRTCQDVGYFTGAACHGIGCYCVYDPVVECVGVAATAPNEDAVVASSTPWPAPAVEAPACSAGEAGTRTAG